MDNKKLETVIAEKQLKTYLELIIYTARERFRTLSTVSALAATLLIVATFNERLIPVTNFVRGLLSILLSVIIVSLWGLLIGLSKAEEYGVEKVKEIMKSFGVDISNEIEEKRKGSITGYLPLVSNIILSIAICMIMLLIWGVPIEQYSINLWKLFF